MDAFITISSAFNKRYEAFNKLLPTMSHAISVERSGASPPPGERRGHGLFVGNLDARLDLSMDRVMAEAFPQTQFLYLGPYHLHGNLETELLIIKRELPMIEYNLLDMHDDRTCLIHCLHQFLTDDDGQRSAPLLTKFARISTYASAHDQIAGFLDARTKNGQA
jgi:hypothetical protein